MTLQHANSIPRGVVTARIAPTSAAKCWTVLPASVGKPNQGASMPTLDLHRRLFAEALGTALLVTTAAGSRIMAVSLTRDVALALLGNTLPTGAILVVLITILGPVSGAHFNPAVSIVFALKHELSAKETSLYIAAQVSGGIAGTMIAHAVFALPLLDASMKVRTRGAQWFA
jgi:glycerol uptake facilitator-like aquaporin